MKTCTIVRLVATIAMPTALTVSLCGSALAQAEGPYSAFLPVALRAPASAHRMAQLGGWSSAVATIGEWVYLAVGPRIVTFDISVPTVPVRIGESELLPQPIDRLYNHEDDLYAVLGEGGRLYRFDPGDGRRPMAVSQYSTEAEIDSVAFRGSVGFVCESDRIVTVRLGARGWMPAVGGIAPGRSEVCTLAGDDILLASVATDGGFLGVFDVGDPRRPSLAGRYDHQYARYEEVGDITVRDHVAFLMYRGASGAALESLDLADPAAPRRLQRVGINEWVKNPRAMTFVGDTLVLAGVDGVALADVTDPAHMVMLGAADPPVGASDVAPGPGVAFAAAGGLTTLDATGPEPSTLSVVRILAESSKLAVLEDQVLVSEPYVRYGVTAPGTHNVFSNRIVAIGPDEDGLEETEAVGLPWMGDQSDIDAMPGVVVVTSWPGLAVIHQSTDAQLAVTDVVELRGGVVATDPSRDMVLHGLGRTILEDDWVGLTDLRVLVIDGAGRARQLGIVTEPVPASEVPLVCGVTARAVATGDRDRAYLAYSVDHNDGRHGCYAGDFDLVTFDVSDPAAPRRIGHHRLPTDSPVADLAVSGDTVVTAGVWTGLRTLDVSDPSAVREIGRLEYDDLPACALSVALRDGRAYIADRTGFVHEIDVSDPAVPKVLASVPVPGRPTDVAVADGAAWVSAEGGGIVRLPLPLAR